MHVLKYLTWNATITGSLILASIYNANAIITVLGIWFTIEALMTFLVSMLPINYDKVQEHMFRWWKFPIEVVLLMIPFYLGHEKIGIAAFITLFSYCTIGIRYKIELDINKKHE